MYVGDDSETVRGGHGGQVRQSQPDERFFHFFQLSPKPFIHSGVLLHLQLLRMHLNNDKFTTLGEGLHRTGRVMRQRLVEALAHLGYDYPVEFWPTLKYVNANPKASQHEIATFLVRDKATVARLLNRMEEKKLVKRVVDPQNRRQKLVELTAHGASSFANIAKCAKHIKQNAEDGLSAEDLQTCQHVLQRVFANLNTTNP